MISNIQKGSGKPTSVHSPSMFNEHLHTEGHIAHTKMEKTCKNIQMHPKLVYGNSRMGEKKKTEIV